MAIQASIPFLPDSGFYDCSEILPMLRDSSAAPEFVCCSGILLALWNSSGAPEFFTLYRNSSNKHIRKSGFSFQAKFTTVKKQGPYINCTVLIQNKFLFSLKLQNKFPVESFRIYFVLIPICSFSSSVKTLPARIFSISDSTSSSLKTW